MLDLVQRMSLLISIEVYVLLATSDEKGNYLTKREMMQRLFLELLLRIHCKLREKDVFKKELP